MSSQNEPFDDRRPEPTSGSAERGSASEVLRRHRERVLKQWAARAVQEIPPAKELDQDELLGKLPTLLDGLIRYLEEEAKESDVFPIAHEHGLVRATHEGFSVDHVFREFTLLQITLWEALASDVALPVAELTSLCEILNRSLREAVRALSDNASSFFKETESRFEQMIHEVEDHAIFMVTPDGRISTWNKGAERIKQYPAQEVLGQPLRILYREEDRAERPSHNLKLAAQHGRYQEEWWRRKKDGSLFWAKVTLTALYSESEDLRGFLKVITDLTERKRYQDDLEKMNSDLERFASVAAHDLQEPLRTVTTFLQRVQKRLEGIEDKDIVDYQRLMVGAMDRMRHLIETLLTYARAGGALLDEETVEVKASVEAALARLQVFLQESGAVITYGELPVVNGDGTLLTQLFQNLLNNAVKFRHAGRAPVIRIEATRGRQEWIFSIRDNGIGMTAEDTQRVFGAFERAHTSEEFSGCGLGLSICHRIVERHRGRIWAESELGNGSTFFFTLPSQGNGPARRSG